MNTPNNAAAALERIEELLAEMRASAFAGSSHCDDVMYRYVVEFEDELAALRATLAQPDALTSQPSGEAVAWEVQGSDGEWGFMHPADLDYYRTKGIPTRPLYTHPSADAPGGEVDEAMVPASSLRELYAAYVHLLETGRDRIIELGGNCDSVEAMERCDFDLHKARIALSPAKENGRE